MHHSFADKADLYPYLSRYYAERFADYGTGVGASHANNGGFRGRRADTIDVDVPQPANIETSAIDVEDTKTQLLDASGIDLAILTGGPGAGASAMLMWKMDIDWKGLRHQTPWVEKLPSEYLKQHIRFSTQPMEEPDNPDAIRHIIDWMDGEHTLMFATDYPHWDWDDPDQTLTTLPDALRRRIFWDHSAKTFGISLPTAANG